MKKENTTRMFILYMMNWKMILDVWVPTLGYYYIYSNYGLQTAIITTAIYGVLIDLLLFSKRNLVIYLLIALGVVELAIALVVPQSMLSEVLAYKAAIGSLQSAIVLIIFSIFKKPIPQVMAERFNKDLLSWKEYQQPHFQHVWQEVSLVWILVSLVKATSFFTLAMIATEQQIVLASNVLGWPIWGALMYFSFYWPSKRWAKFSQQVATSQS